MNDVMHKQRFPGTKDKSSFLLNFIRSPQLVLYELSIPRPLQAFVIRNQSENETELRNKENQLAWTKEIIKKKLTSAPLGYSADRAPLGGGRISPPPPAQLKNAWS